MLLRGGGKLASRGTAKPNVSPLLLGETNHHIYIHAAHLSALFFTRFDKVVGILPVFQKVLIRSVQNSHPHVTKLLLKEILDVSAHVEYVRHSCTQREYIAIYRVSTKSRIVFSFIKSN